MYNGDINLYLQKKLYDDKNKYSEEVLSFLLDINSHLILKVLRIEPIVKELSSKIDLTTLYEMGIYGLTKGILEFNIEEDDIDNYYYNYLIKFYTNISEQYMDIGDGFYVDDRGTNCFQFVDKSKKDRADENKETKRVLKTILNDEEFSFIEKLYGGKFTPEEFLELLENKNSVLFNTIETINRKIEESVEQISLCFKRMEGEVE